MTDSKYFLGIQNAVQVCMNVSGTDRVFIISDQETREIGQALLNKSIGCGAETTLIKLEDFGKRPLLDVPDKLIESLVEFKPTVTFFAAGGQAGEVKMRMALTGKIRSSFTDLGLPLPRHAHMISITPQLIMEGMTADYVEINRLTMIVTDLVKDAKTIRVTSEKGTDITATFDPDYHWIPCHGLYHQAGDWGNLPEGEVFTCPKTLDGVLVVDVLGDYFSPKYGVLENPVRIEVHDSIVTKVTCADESISDELFGYLNSSENGLRAGEFAIGTNTAVTKLSGNLLQDEKIPGIHVAFGNPIGYQTGADWTSDVHVDVVPTNCTITVDGKKIMKNGFFQL